MPFRLPYPLHPEQVRKGGAVSSPPLPHRNPSPAGVVLCIRYGCLCQQGRTIRRGEGSQNRVPAELTVRPVGEHGTILAGGRIQGTWNYKRKRAVPW